MKFGYECKCGWKLRRKGLTRKEYASAKRTHAMGVEAFSLSNPSPEAIPSCRFLKAELSRTQAKP